MLSYSVLRNHAGILLCGDYTSLRWVHDTAHAVNERSVLVKDKEGAFLGLAYDVRKAYERQREIVPPPAHCEEIGTRYGVKILWPVILLQQRMLRASLACFDHSSRDQAVCYALEAVLADALKEDFGSRADAIVARWRGLDLSNPTLFDCLRSRGALFSSWTGHERRKRFSALLDSFDPLYEELYTVRVQQGESDLIAPGDFEFWSQRQWPDPCW